VKVPEVKTLKNWKAVAEMETLLNATSPIRGERPFIISQLKPVQYNQQWCLQDIDNNIMPVKNDYKQIWKLLSISGALPMDMAVIGKEDRFEPLGVWQAKEYIII
jgi:hypothetical protein